MLGISIILPADDIHTLSVNKDFTDDMVRRIRLSTLKVWIRKKARDIRVGKYVRAYIYIR